MALLKPLGSLVSALNPNVGRRLGRSAGAEVAGAEVATYKMPPKGTGVIGRTSPVNEGSHRQHLLKWKRFGCPCSCADDTN